MLIPIGLELVSKYEQNQLLKEIRVQIATNEQKQKQTKEKQRENRLEETPYTTAETQLANLELEHQDVKKSKNVKYKRSDIVDQILKYQEIIGIISIKKLDITFPVVEGAERENIRAAIGHIKGTADFGEAGNCVLAGHRGGVYGVFFKYINKLETGDKVKLTDINGKNYNYTVYDQFVVEPTDMQIIQPIGEEKTLTLLSCEAGGTKRLIIRCRLVK